MKRFKSNPKFYEANLRDSKTAAAVPAGIMSPDGTETPGVAIMTTDMPRVVITLDAALKVAHEIANAIERMKR